MSKQEFLVATWEDYDASALFPDRLHANKLTKIDKVNLNKVDQDEDGEQGNTPDGGESGPPQDGDTVSQAPPDQNHADNLYEMEGDGGEANDREVKADKEEDLRTEKPEEQNGSADEAGQESSEGDSQSGDSESEASDAEGKESSQDGEPEDSDESDDAEADEAEGAEKPIQKESEGVEEVAEATSKTSEDVHGGDEATKDIEDSPNPANDGQNPDNEGAEDGEGGDSGEGDGSADGEAEGGQAGDGEANEAESDADNPADPFGEEDWEAMADNTAGAINLLNDLSEVARKNQREEEGHRTTLPQYNFNRETTPAELEVVYRKAGELMKLFANEENLTERIHGAARWDAKTIARRAVTYKHHRIPQAKFQRPKEADIVLLMDISGSCAAQAEMFMAISAACVGPEVAVYIGYNGCARKQPLTAPKRKPRSYAKAKAWVSEEVANLQGWDKQQTIGEWQFREFVEEVRPKTLLIFGDFDGRDLYCPVGRDPKFKDVDFFWIANVNAQSGVPEGFTQKNYIPNIFGPQDFLAALRKIRR